MKISKLSIYDATNHDAFVIPQHQLLIYSHPDESLVIRRLMDRQGTGYETRIDGCDGKGVE